MKRNFWRRNEVKCMLKVFKELQVVQLLDQKVLPVNDIYKRVEMEMARRGYNKKNGKQIQSKWSQMKSAHICRKRNHNPDFYKTKDVEFRDEVGELIDTDPEENNIPVKLPKLPEYPERFSPIEQDEPDESDEKLKNPFKQGSYKKSFWKFMQQMRSLQKDLLDDFCRKQRRLMEYEHRLQEQRDDLIISSFSETTNHIVTTTNELIEKIFNDKIYSAK